MFIPLKMVLIGIDPYPTEGLTLRDASAGYAEGSVWVSGYILPLNLTMTCPPTLQSLATDFEIFEIMHQKVNKIAKLVYGNFNNCGL